jgi:hypothetical protein
VFDGLDVLANLECITVVFSLDGVKLIGDLIWPFIVNQVSYSVY